MLMLKIIKIFILNSYRILKKKKYFGEKIIFPFQLLNIFFNNLSLNLLSVMHH